MIKQLSNTIHKMKGASLPDNVKLQVEVVGLNGTLSIENVSRKESVIDIFKVA